MQRRRAKHAYFQSRCKVERQGSTRQPCASPLEHRRILVASGRRLLDSYQASKLEQSALKQALDVMRLFEGWRTIRPGIARRPTQKRPGNHGGLSGYPAGQGRQMVVCPAMQPWQVCRWPHEAVESSELTGKIDCDQTLSTTCLWSCRQKLGEISRAWVGCCSCSTHPGDFSQSSPGGSPRRDKKFRSARFQ